MMRNFKCLNDFGTVKLSLNVGFCSHMLFASADICRNKKYKGGHSGWIYLLASAVIYFDNDLPLKIFFGMLVLGMFLFVLYSFYEISGVY